VRPVAQPAQLKERPTRARLRAAPLAALAAEWEALLPKAPRVAQSAPDRVTEAQPARRAAYLPPPARRDE